MQILRRQVNKMRPWEGKMNNEWNYMQCNQCYVMFPHLAVPEVCVCGNDMNCNSTRKKFILSFRVKDLIDDYCNMKNHSSYDLFKLFAELTGFKIEEFNKRLKSSSINKASLGGKDESR